MRISLVLLLLLSINSFAQEKIRDIKEILSNPFFKSDHRLTYDEIINEADQFFELKYPQLSSKNLSSGELKDSDFVKY